MDEGHRLKNEQSRLTAALATLRTRARFLLTGTPLQNRLGELWALLNFILPSVFSCSDSFDAWFGGAFGGSSSVRQTHLTRSAAVCDSHAAHRSPCAHV